MNQEAAMKELTGQTLKLAEQFKRKEEILANMEKENAELEEIKLTVKNLDGIIQTLQFLVQTNGFENVQGMEPQPVPPTLPTSQPARTPPTLPTPQPARTPSDAVSKALAGGQE